MAQCSVNAIDMPHISIINVMQHALRHYSSTNSCGFGYKWPFKLVKIILGFYITAILKKSLNLQIIMRKLFFLYELFTSHTPGEEPRIL